MHCKHCSTLQHNAYTATYCNTLQHTATHCNTLQIIATHCNALYHTALQHTTKLATQNDDRAGVLILDLLKESQLEADFRLPRWLVKLQHTGTHFNALQHSATYSTSCNTLQYTATHCNTLHHSATHYYSICCQKRLKTDFRLPRWLIKLQHTATHCKALQHTATYCSAHCNFRLPRWLQGGEVS